MGFPRSAYGLAQRATRMDAIDADAPSGTSVSSSLRNYAGLFQAQLDRTTPHTLNRWGCTALLLVLFFARILLAQAYFILCYGLGIYLLNLFLAFLQPKFDPSLAADLAESEVEEGAPGLPTSMPPPPSGRGTYADLQDGEFRPFIRRLPEFKFWSVSRAFRPLPAEYLVPGLRNRASAPPAWPAYGPVFPPESTDAPLAPAGTLLRKRSSSPSSERSSPSSTFPSTGQSCSSTFASSSS